MVVFGIFLILFFGPVKKLVFGAASLGFEAGGVIKDIGLYLPKLLTDKHTLIEKNTELEGELEKLRLSLLDADSLESENLILRRELGFSRTEPAISAFVVASPPMIPLDTLMIGLGAEEVSIGDLVVVGERIALGSVARIFGKKSDVVLNTFPGILSYGHNARTNESVEFVGVGGGVMESTMPINFDIEVGDQILLLRDRTYLLGVVNMIEEDATSGSKNILVSLPVGVSKLEVVSVVSF